MFEMGAAAGASLSLASSGAEPILSQASIAAPCQLSVPELKCLISLRYRKDSQMNLTAKSVYAL